MVQVYSKPKIIDSTTMDLGSSRPTSSLKVVLAAIRMNLHLFVRYRANYVGAIIEVTILVLSMFLFSQVVNFRSIDVFAGNPHEYGLFIFFLTGVLMMLFQNSALFVPVNSVRRDLYNGTLEYVYSGPQSRYAYLVGNVVADILIRQIFVVPMLILLFVLTGIDYNALLLLASLLVFFVVVVSVGILVSLMAITWKQVGNLVGILGILVQFVGGAFMPVQTFPVFLQWFAYLIPFTFAYDMARYYSLQGQWTPLVPIEFEWLIMLGYALIYFIISRYLLKKVERYAKNQGLHIL